MRGCRKQLTFLLLLLFVVARGAGFGGQSSAESSVQNHQLSVLVSEGIAQAREGHFARAEAAYRRALGIDPHCIPAEINLGLGLLQIRRLRACPAPLCSERRATV